MQSTLLLDAPALSSLQFEPPLNPVMMLWVNLIMDTMGALSLVRQRVGAVLLEAILASASPPLLSSPALAGHSAAL